MTSNLARPHGYKMIHSLEVRNFRCFRNLAIKDCKRLNVIVGDNGTGKTALLESIFLPLSTSSEVAVRLRQQRGLDGSLGGSAKRIEEGLWGDFFFNNDMSKIISIILEGEGRESRSIQISRGSPESRLEFEGDSQSFSAPVVFTWTDHLKQARSVVPQVSQSGLTLPDTGEDNPDFFFFSSNQTIGSVENASRFSELSKASKHERFVKTFSQEYSWIENLNIEVHCGAPAIFGSLYGSDRKVPLPNISSGINRVIGIMLSIAARSNSVVVVDEIENGIYYRHLPSLWRSILAFLREFDAQMFVSTHSMECLSALVEAAGNDVDDIALWRTERENGESAIYQFSGDELKAGVEFGEDVR